LRNGALALAVMVIVVLPAGSGLGDIAVMVGPGPSGLTYTIAEIPGLALEVALMRTDVLGSFEGAMYRPA
jgi:hypothetical protein